MSYYAVAPNARLEYVNHVQRTKANFNDYHFNMRDFFIDKDVGFEMK